MQIEIAHEKEFAVIQSFYHDLIHAMKNRPHKPGWEIGVYPSDAYLRESLQNKQLYIGRIGEEIAAGMILNQTCAEGYASGKWKIDATPEQVMILHTLATALPYQGRGLAREMVDFAVKSAVQRGMKAIRLDVLSTNLPAVSFYPALGFQYINTVTLFYEDTGFADFLLYERQV